MKGEQLDMLLNASAAPNQANPRDPVLDGPRLKTLEDRVWRLMQDYTWRTLREIVSACGGSEAGVSATLRRFRKAPYHSRVAKRRRGEPRAGLWEYRVS
jgi:hypothetical protein